MLVNVNNANKEVATVYGTIKFNEKGECKDLTETQEKALAKLSGYEHVTEKKDTSSSRSTSTKKEPTKDKKEEKPKKK